MIKKYYLILGLMVSFVTLFSCSDDDTNYSEIPTPEVSPVSVNLALVPYSKLSEYHFFEGLLKNQSPSLNVLPYAPASSLFSDYAHKKRFVWMPKNTKATYNGDDNTLEFPIGTALIKTFYYDNVLPNHTQKIIETRLLIRKSDGWKAYNYIWNEDQTEANLDNNQQGISVPIEWSENGVTKNTTYKIPSQNECITCHKINPNQIEHGEITIPIGVKPQNLNLAYNYGDETKNQLEKWKSVGYLDASTPTSINATVNWENTNETLEKRVRSYIDINCGHCHRTGGHCDYVSIRLNYSNTDLNTFGVCMTPLFSIPNGPFVINAGNADQSEMIQRMSSTEESLMMPYIGRTLVHEEGLDLIQTWINSLPPDCH
ncbi:hypothetical protein [Flavobacterium sp. J27]|uniref:hypothetical protein n=1 Tax=Flavobacterium sp. J27 TaxID=2060419 RepID=UPI001031777C|nr:hypothetical protein [Flavobacterium sp. J27]